MDKMKIVICDENTKEANEYAGVCRGICGKNQILLELNTYNNLESFMFDMSDISFSAQVNILIVDPKGCFESMPFSVRKNGYNGMILYLSHSTSLEHYRQAFDADAYNFVQKGKSPEIFARFQSVFESALQNARQLNRKYLMVSYAGEYKRIDVKDIQYFETASDHMIEVVYNGGRFKFLSTMQNMEERFKDHGFVRVHRSYLVSVNAIHRVGSDELTLNSGNRILVSRDRFPSLRSAMAC